MSGYHIFENPAEGFQFYIDRLLEQGSPVMPRGAPTYELVDEHMVFKWPNAIIQTEGRNWKFGIAAVEALSLVGQCSIPEQLTKRFKVFDAFVDEGALWGAYGPRIAGDLGQCVKTLQNDHFSRQAVLTIFDSNRDLNRNGVNDVPCTIAIQFMIRDGQVNMRVIMRSNDIWLGYPYDTIQFFALQSALAQCFGLPVGTYSHLVGSLHLYLRDLARAESMRYQPPVTRVFKPPFWAGQTIGEISSRAREILMGDHLGDTEFERWLAAQIA